MSGVKLEKVVKKYDNGVEVIHGIDLEIKQGEFVVFVTFGLWKIHPDAHGRGLESITGGTISIEGQVVKPCRRDERDSSPWCFQDYALYPHKSCSTTGLA